MKKTLFSLLGAWICLAASAAYQRVSVHDPSIVNDNGTYYVFGSHHAAARSTDLMNWTDISSSWRWATATSSNATHAQAFTTQQVTKVTIDGAERDFGNFNAQAWSGYGSSGYSIDGNMWAPDVIWNSAMQKWCMYLSINGEGANCSILLLTADNITGPYRYQAPVVVSGFYMAGINFHDTDMELALGDLSDLPDRYKTGTLSGWRHRWPNCIDPCVFYDEQGKLWMSYGSWHGGIWMLELDEQTGLRDYSVKYDYQTNGGNADDVRSDPYYGKRIAGGFQVSGEASYIKHIGQYYYLFVTYGGLAANGGYQMRVFRSENPDGPYTDSYHTGAVAIYDAARVNYGPDGTRKTDRGENIFGAYGDWGYQTVGDWAERSQGHNSVTVSNGQTFLVYHTRFQNRGEGHEVRVHQMFLNQDGWLCAAPFEYSGETVTDDQLAGNQQFSNEQLTGTYKLLIHTYNLDHANMQLALPVIVSLNADGTITGEASGTWSTQGGTSYITVRVNDIEYKGVVVEQTLEPTTEKAICLTAYAKSNGYTVWAYQLPEGYQNTVGATDDSSAYLGAFSTPLQLSDGQAAVFEFTNYSSKANNWNNWVACVSPGTAINTADLLIALRADRWENVQYSADGVSCNYNWTTFKDDMDGSKVVLTFRYLNGSITIRADITTAAGVPFYEEFTKAGISGAVTVYLSVDGSHLVVSKAEVTDASGVSAIMADGPRRAPCYNLSGQQVSTGYKGLVIESGRKHIQR